MYLIKSYSLYQPFSKQITDMLAGTSYTHLIISFNDRRNIKLYKNLRKILINIKYEIKKFLDDAGAARCRVARTPTTGNMLNYPMFQRKIRGKESHPPPLS
jgi:hypothetical protein